MISINRDIPAEYIFDCLGYAFFLVAGFTSFGVFVLLQKDYS